MNTKKAKLLIFLFTLLYFFSSTVAPVLADVTYSYDANGNMTSDGQNCYTYNDANQLSQVKNCATNQVIAQYVYDYQGNRIEKKIYNSGSLQKTVYSPDKTYETVKLASGGTATTGAWTIGNSAAWAAVIVSFNSAGTAPALVQKGYVVNGGTGSVATTFGSNVTTGNTIIVMTVSSFLDTTSVTDNQGNTYTQIGTTQSIPGSQFIRMWYAKNVTGGSVTVTSHQSGSSSGCAMEILEYSGLSKTSPADQVASTTGTSVNPSGGSITPTNNNALIISAFTDGNNDGVSMTGTSGYTVEETDLSNSTSNRNGIEDEVMTSGAATANTSYYFVNDQLAAKKNPDGSKNYYYDDSLHSTSVLANQSGAVVENSTYYPYGQIRSGGTQSKYAYTGQENDQETNLDYYNSRYYNPNNNHFTQPDSELPNIYDPQQLNRYSYVRDNPLTYNDPSGHCIGPLFAVCAAGVILAPVIIMYAPAIIAQISQAIQSIQHNSSPANIAYNVFDVGSTFVPEVKAGGAVAKVAGSTVKDLKTTANIGNVARNVSQDAVKGANFTKNNFRSNLGQLTGSIQEGADAHHIFPQKFRSTFEDAGLNIDDPQYGAWWEKHDHRSNAYQYNQDWQKFIQGNPDATIDDYLNKGRSMSSDYGVSTNY